jgi:hypothetical protein
MKKLPKILIVALLAGLLMPSFVYAQMQQQIRNRFENEYRITDEVISHARNIIASSGIDKGRELLKLAEQIQSQARTMGMNRNFEQGVTTTLRAREQAKNATSLNQQANENANLVRHQLEKTERLLEQLRSNMPSDAGHKMESLYNSARENQRRAREFYHNQQLRPALKLSRQVENTLKRLLERFKEMNGNLRQLQNQINRMENKLNRVENMLENCGDERAEQITSEVKNRFEEIKRFQNNRDFAAIEKRLRIMNQRLNSVIESCQGTDFQMNQLRRLKSEIERISDVIMESQNKRAQKLFRSAEKNLGEAERFCRDGDSENCAANIRAAQINLRKAMELAGI